MKKIIISGGNGNLPQKIIRNNKKYNLVPLNKDEMNVSNIESVESNIRKEKPDYFINFAANSFVGSSWDMPVNHMQTNAMAVLHQLEAIENMLLIADITTLDHLKNSEMLCLHHKMRCTHCGPEARMEHLSVPLDIL